MKNKNTTIVLHGITIILGYDYGNYFSDNTITGENVLSDNECDQSLIPKLRSRIYKEWFNNGFIERYIAEYTAIRYLSANKAV